MHFSGAFLSLSSTTTVVMKARGSVDESVAEARVVGNDCDEPRAASCVETVTKPVAPRATARVRAAQWPTSDALPAPSTQQAHQLWSFFFLLLSLDAGQPSMGHHRQGDVAVPAVPEAHFILIPTGLPLCLFHALLDGVAPGGPAHHRLK